MMSPGELEAAIAEYTDLLTQMGVPSEDRDRLTERLRYTAALPPDSPSRVFELVGQTVDLFGFTEAYLRDCGYEPMADFYARVGLAYSLWLEMPTELAKFAGFPNPRE